MDNPTLYINDIYAWHENISAEKVIDEPAEAKKIEKGIILPVRIIEASQNKKNWMLEGGVCSADGNFVAGQERKLEKPGNRSCNQAYEFDKKILEYRDETVIFGGILFNHWGHMLVDSTSRLWYLIHEANQSTKIVFTMYEEEPFRFMELLKLAGISEERVEILRKPTQFTEVIVPDETFHSLSGKYRKEWKYFFDSIRDNISIGSYKKIYLTKTQLQKKDIIGEDYFEKYFCDKGFEVIAPEKLSVKEQIEIIAGAEEIATTTGTLSHMVLFAKDGVELLALNRHERQTRAQLGINSIKSVKCTYVDVSKNFLPEAGSDSVWLLAPTDNWRRFVNDRYGEESNEDYDEATFALNAIEYIKIWGDIFSNISNYKWIKNLTQKDLVKRINNVINGKIVDVSEFPETQFVGNQGKKIRALEKDVATFEKELVLLQKKYNKVINSNSYRVGRIITAMPRRIKRFVQNGGSNK